MHGLGDDRVRATFFLITYNQELYVREAIEGAFSQTYSPLEIVISDDCSTDGTFRIIEEISRGYEGPHKLVINRNPVNLGLIGHINSITTLSSGELIVYAAGDDISLPDRTKKLVECYLASERKASLIHSSVYLIDNAGNIQGSRTPEVIEHGMEIAEMALSGSLIIGATSAFTRKIEETFGPIRYHKCIEDLVMGFRSTLIGGLDSIKEPLVLYRHEAGITARSDMTQQTCDQWTKRKICDKEAYLAVLSQRIDDLKRIGNEGLLPLLQRKRFEELLTRKVWIGDYNFVKLASYSLKRGVLKEFVNSWLREKKWRFSFSLKNFMYKPDNS